MKNRIRVCGLAIALGLFTIGSSVTHAQTSATNAPSSIPNFFVTAASWATTFDTNKDWAPVTFQFEDGLNQTTGTGAADYIRGQYNLSRWNLSVEGDFFGVGSSFNAVEGGGGFALIQKHDFKAEINALIGGTKIGTASGDAWRFKAEPEIKITKLMTANTYTTISLSVPWIEGQKFDGTPAFRVGMGFTF